jgi:hypothetical protein
MLPGLHPSPSGLYVSAFQISAFKLFPPQFRPRKPSNPDPDGFDQSPTWKPKEIQLDDGLTLALEYN